MLRECRTRRIRLDARCLALLPVLYCLSVTLVFAQATDVNCVECVDTQDIASRAVTNGKIGSGAVTADKLARDAVTTNKIRQQSVTRSKIRAKAVTTGKLAESAVTAEKIAPSAVGITQIDPTQVQVRVTEPCPPGLFLTSIGQDGSVTCNAIVTQLWVAKSPNTNSVAFATCPAGTIILSANCECDSENFTRNLGVLFGCAIAGNGGGAGCYLEPFTYNSNLPDPRAIIQVQCAGEVQVTNEISGKEQRDYNKALEHDSELKATVERLELQAIRQKAALSSRR